MESDMTNATQINARADHVIETAWLRRTQARNAYEALHADVDPDTPKALALANTWIREEEAILDAVAATPRPFQSSYGWHLESASVSAAIRTRSRRVTCPISSRKRTKLGSPSAPSYPRFARSMLWEAVYDRALHRHP